jgi:hypothetical protein
MTSIVYLYPKLSGWDFPSLRDVAHLLDLLPLILFRVRDLGHAFHLLNPSLGPSTGSRICGIGLKWDGREPWDLQKRRPLRIESL